MNRVAFAALAAAFAALGPTVEAQQQPDFSNVEIKTTPLGNGLFMLEGQGGNITVAVTGDGIIMVDDQFAPLSDKIKTAIAALSPGKIRYLVNTHHHGDRTGGNANFAKDGVTIVAQENLRSRLAGNALNNQGAAAAAAPAAALPIVTFKDGMNLRLGGKNAEIVHVPPSHTDGDSYVYFRNENVLATGDIFSSTRFPNVDVRNGGGIDGMIAVQANLLQTSNDDTKIVPGHGPLAKRADIIAFRDMLRTSRDRVAKLVTEGKSEDEVIAAKPLADLEVTRKTDDANRDAFTRLVYRSIKARS
jgi:glyoxylase-like metal-dependent hydrolase (beta-lactamase superfamily II)